MCFARKHTIRKKKKKNYWWNLSVADHLYCIEVKQINSARIIKFLEINVMFKDKNYFVLRRSV